MDYIGVWKNYVVVANIFGTLKLDFFNNTEYIVFGYTNEKLEVVSKLKTDSLEIREFSVLGEYIAGVTKMGR